MRVFLIRCFKALLAIGLALVGLFTWNGLETSWRVPTVGSTAHPERVLSADETAAFTLTTMAWNIAKCDFHQRGTEFKSEADVRAQLDRMAEVITAAGVDLLFLSEVVLEATPCPVNQVEYLAEKAGFAHWCYGDNYSFGIPGARIRSGNAFLSKLPMEALRVDQLPGGTPFWRPTGNRRILWAEIELLGERVECASLRNDSFDLKNNAEQVRGIVAGLSTRPTVAAGDFNAKPGTEALRLWKASGRFAGVFDGAPTFPATGPNRRIDTVLLPAEWSAQYGATWSDEVLDVDLSDHEPVVVRVRLDPGA